MSRVAHVAAMAALSLVVVGAGTVPPSPTTSTTPPTATPPVAASGEPDGERVVLGHLSRKLNMSAETLRGQRAQMGLGWGDLFIANRLALETQTPFETLVAEMRGGQDWESVARAHGADLQRLQTDVRASEEAVEQRSEDKSPHATTVPDSGKGHGRGGGAGRKRGS
jgi:hypothetical protein